MTSLLSYLLAGSEQEEVHATNTLTYLLDQRQAYADVLVADWAKQTGTELPPRLTFAAEIRVDEGRLRYRRPGPERELSSNVGRQVLGGIDRQPAWDLPDGAAPRD